MGGEPHQGREPPWVEHASMAIADGGTSTLFESTPDPVIEYRSRENELAVARVNAAFQETFDVDEEDAGCDLEDTLLTGKRPNEGHSPEIGIVESVHEGTPVVCFKRCETMDGTRRFLVRTVPLDERGYVQYIPVPEGETSVNNDDVAGMIAHDLRNPLDVAQMRIDLAQTTGDEEHFEQALTALDRMERIIEETLQLAREGTLTDLEPTDLEAIAHKAWNTVDTGNAELVLRDPGTVRGDPDGIQQLFENLFRNAVEHGSSDATIEVGSLEDGFYVADDGTGVPSEKQNKLFDPGFSTEQENTGLGLAIVAKIAKAHGWSIDLDPDADGACFEMRRVDSLD